jgi:hypothetical protein
MLEASDLGDYQAIIFKTFDNSSQEWKYFVAELEVHFS